MSKLHELANLGQSIWLDFIRRQILDSGELNRLHASGVRGVTSNPSIFEKAIADSDDYNDDLDLLIAKGKSTIEIYEALAIEDIKRACDVFMDLYRQTDGEDGYVSLEANPQLAYKTEETIAEARRLFKAVDRPNVYIKVPATPEGIPAIRQLIGEGININVTLIFAVSAYEEVAEAYLSGLEQLAEKGGDLSNVSSVASFFVSRVDTKADKLLAEKGNESLQGKIGIANAKMGYQRFLQIFSGPRWEALADKGARVQRPLWGSTSTKNPDYPDTLYVDSLIGPHTVNTVPPETLEAILDHGTVARTIDRNPELARQQLEKLESLGVSLDRITDELLDEGVKKFADAFASLLDTIEARKAGSDGKEQTQTTWTFALGDSEEAVNQALVNLRDHDVLPRIWQKDYTLWSDEPAEITNRLGWLDIAQKMRQEIHNLDDFAATAKEDGFRRAVLMGMGGSSLAPELFARAFGKQGDYLQLTVLDSTDPQAVSALQAELDPQETLFIVSSKSGGTVETISFFKAFYNWLQTALKTESVGGHFVAITDPGSQLAELAKERNFRALFLNEATIGGRYSALSHFGLVPAALLGLDLDRLLARATQIDGPDKAEHALELGAAMGVGARSGRDKLTIITSPQLASFGDWVEQLIAESTGKDGSGILPVVGEPLMPAERYGSDRLFVIMRLHGEAEDADAVAHLKEAGHPLITIVLDDLNALGEQFVIWEVATAVAGHVLGIHPFNQPNVESAKRKAKEMMATFRESGSLPGKHTVLKAGGIEVQGSELPASTPAEALRIFVDSAPHNGYIAIHAYVQPTAQTDEALHNFRDLLNRHSGLAVTVGYGPRFLHSTGQLHKGDAGHGVFIQLVSEPLADVPIPDTAGQPQSTLTFGVLKMAQALGDARALTEAGRPVVRFAFGGDTVQMLEALMAAF